MYLASSDNETVNINYALSNAPITITDVKIMIHERSVKIMIHERSV